MNKITLKLLFEAGLLISVAIATVVCKSGLGPTAEILSFAPPKESIQRKGGPDAAFFLRYSDLNGVA
ncbi:hypothetical protein [Methylomonas methanica]|uniref:Uncharacterized protein n=1 Tax=Methylomonas methanica TaxID=421 RepID=A0A177MVH5_METMH|nr:hypothetical protein [Methylomonas methanica]OAI09243.1 hypothetical protein A1332_05990 [Methylomonas methanica]